MGRPRVPLISRRRALEAALEIIDTDGIECLSIRNLADRLKVTGASLYHHFENKQEIVLGAARLALEGAYAPRHDDEPWRIWMVRSARRLRQALRDHPDLASVILHRQPLGIGLAYGTAHEDATVALLAAEDIPTGAVAPMLEALELYAIGSALHETLGGAERTDEPAGRSHLAEAVARRAVSPDEVFELVCEKIIDSVLATAAERQAR